MGQRRVFLVVCGTLLVAAAIAFRGVLLPFFLAVLVAYVLAPVINRVQRVAYRGRSFPRWAAVFIVYVTLLGLVGAGASVGIPRLFVEVQQLASALPAEVARFRDHWIPALEDRIESAMGQAAQSERADEQRAGAEPADTPPPEQGPPAPGESNGSIRIKPIDRGRGGYEVLLPSNGLVVERKGERVIVHAQQPESTEDLDLAGTLGDALRSVTEHTQQHAATVLQTLRSVAAAVVRGVFVTSIMVMLSAYLVTSAPAILRFFRSLVEPRRRESFDALLRRVDRGLAGVVRGQLLIALINGALSGLGFWWLDLPYWPILTLIATLLSIIPIFGALLSSVPAVLLSFQVGWWTAVWVVVWIVLIHQIEANVLNPKIMGDAAEVHPVLVILALLAGEHLFGVAGALLAVPVLSITQSLFLHYRDVALGGPTPPAQAG